MSHEERLRALLEAQLLRAPMPSAGVAVAQLQGPELLRVHGTANVFTGERVSLQHWWDLASLTKTLVTLPILLDLHRAGVLDLAAPLSTQWEPAANSPLANATLQELLSYSAGQAPTTRLWEQEGLSRADLVRGTLNLPLRPGQGATYSDLGFLLAAEMAADLAGVANLRAAAGGAGWRWGPLPNGTPVVATEVCSWRQRLIRGEVHDENAAMLGGFAGHAGAFGTLDLITRAAMSWLVAVRQDDPLAVLATSERSHGHAGERFGLGWWLPPSRSLGGTRPGAQAFGMSGFVGNRVWIEPDRGYVIVVLSNRVHPVRSDRGPFDNWCGEFFDTVGDVLSV